MNFYSAFPNAKRHWDAYLFKTLLVMKMMMLFISLTCMQVAAKVKAQVITIAAEKAPITIVMKQIEKQSNYIFIYKDALIKQSTAVTLNVNAQPLTAVLERLFANQAISYEIVGRNIILKPKAQQAPSNKPTPQKKIRGKITDANGLPMAGVSINVKGTQRTTISDAQGNYTIDANEGQVLLYTYLGYTAQERTLGSETEININLTDAVGQLQVVSVVSTGFQTIPKERSTGSFAQVDNELFDRRVSTNVLDRLEGVVSSLSFNKNYFTANANSSAISVRGLSTIFANAKPLIVLDNFPFDGDLANINPNDVESITVLKDAAAASIWGARSGNGVIVITSKKGRLDQKMSISFNANYTLTSKPDIFYSPNFINAPAFIDAEKFLFGNGYYNADLNSTTRRPLVSPVVEILLQQRNGTITEAQANALIDPYRNIDFRDDQSEYLYRKTGTQQYALNIAGGGAKSAYYFSAGYDDAPSTQVGDNYSRLSLKSAATYTPLKDLELTVAIIYSSSDGKDNSLGNLVPGTKTTYYPYARLVDDNGNAAALPKDYRYSYINGLGTSQLLDWSYRPIDELGFSDNTTKLDNARFNAGIKYTVLPGLSVEGRYQLEKQNIAKRNDQTQDSYYTRNLINLNSQVIGTTITRPIPLGNILDQRTEALTGNAFRAQLNLDKAFGDRHQINAIAGIDAKELIINQNRWVSYGYSGLVGTTSPVDYNTTFTKYSSLAASGKIPYLNSVDKQTDEYFSYFANAAYTYLNKYTFSASGRIDQSNLFGVNVNQKSVPLWSVGAAWQASKESFYHLNWLPYLKLRTTYGYNGNIDKSVSAFTTARASGADGVTGAQTVTLVNPPNPELRWEQIAMFNVGLDFATKKNLLSGSIEYYHKKGTDIIGFAPTDPTTGVKEFKGNVANIIGNGLDIELNISVGNTLKWNSTILYSHAIDKVTAYNRTTSVGSYLQNGDGTTSALSLTPIVGSPILSVYSYQWAGLDPSNGDPRGIVNGIASKDYAAISNSANISDAIFHGSARPIDFGSFRNTLSYKNVSISANITYKLNYFFRKPTINYSTFGSGWQMNSEYYDRWKQPGDENITSVPSFVYPLNTARDNFYRYSSVNVEKGDHIRLQDVQIEYFMGDLIKSTLFKRLWVYGYANNLGVVWKATKTNLDPDYVNSTFTNPKTYALGVRATF